MTPGWFGKLASLGDFASRRLPAECLQVCDEWLSQCIAASRAQLGSDWLAVYLAAPSWHFAWAPQVFDDRWWFGVLMPSCDSVGRYFPLLVMQPRAHPPRDAAALAALDHWQHAVGDAAAATLDDGSSVERFESLLHELPPLPNWPGTAAPMAGTDGLGARWQRTAMQRLQARWTGCSLWWCNGSQALGSCADRFEMTAGLPEPRRFAELLRGTF